MRAIFIQKLTAVSLIMIMFACSNDVLFEDPGGLQKEVTANTDPSVFVSLEQAADVAHIFLSEQADGSKLKSRAATLKAEDLVATTETVKEKSVPQMYIINYPEGGWVIVSATRSYYPILAYSDEGNFSLSEDMGGALVWLEETKEAIKASDQLDEETKAAMHTLWSRYETVEYSEITARSSQNTPYDAWQERLMEIYYQHGPDGWYQFYTLQDAQHLFSSLGTYDYLCQIANEVGSPLEYTIVAVKEDYAINRRVNPLLSTKWHALEPFNHLVHPSHAGSAAVAMAQVMKYHQHPLSYNWSNMPDLDDDTDPAIHSTPALIREIGVSVFMNYDTDHSTTTMANVRNAFLSNKFQYSTATIASHSSNNVINELYNKRDPVIMFGRTTAGIQHFWVCDGVIHNYVNSYYFVEFLRGNPHSGYFYSSLGYTSAQWPGYLTSFETLFFHLNWGNGVHIGWFVNNNFSISLRPGVSFNPKEGRQNLYISK